MTDTPRRIPRRTKSGKFSKRGKYVAIEGRLVRFDIGPIPSQEYRIRPGRPTERARARDGSGAGGGPLLVPGPIISENPTERRGARYSTWFKALGTAGRREDMRGAESPDLLSEDLEEFAAPAAFYSNMSGLLGQVRFRGVVPLENLIDKLNVQLQFAGEESRDFDFRNAYASWEYRYQVIESLGPADRVITEIRDSYPRGRGRR